MVEPYTCIITRQEDPEDVSLDFGSRYSADTHVVPDIKLFANNTVPPTCVRIVPGVYE